MPTVTIPGTSREIVDRMKNLLLNQGEVLRDRYQNEDKFCIFGSVMSRVPKSWRTLGYYSIEDLIKSGDVLIIKNQDC